MQVYHQVIRGRVCLENCSGLITGLELKLGIWLAGEWMAGDFISLQFQGILLYGYLWNFMEMLLKVKGAQSFSLSMLTISWPCFRCAEPPSWCFPSCCRNSSRGLACVWYLDHLDGSNKFLSTELLLKPLQLSGLQKPAAIGYVFWVKMLWWQEWGFLGVVFQVLFFVVSSEKVAFPSYVLKTTLERVNWKFTLKIAARSLVCSGSSCHYISDDFQPLLVRFKMGFQLEKHLNVDRAMHWLLSFLLTCWFINLVLETGFAAQYGSLF